MQYPSSILKSLRPACWLIAVLAFCTIEVGCNFRFGNQVVAPDSPDKISGYYETAPQQLTFCASIPPSTEKCIQQPSNQIPAELSQVMTNPLALILKDLASGQAFLVGLTSGNPTLPIDVSPDQSLSFLGAGVTEILWLDPSCTTKLYVEESGKLHPGGPFTTGFNQKLMGRIEAEITMIRTLDGPCTASLKSMQDCYLDAKQCGGATDTENTQRQDLVQATFGDWIRAGAMAVGDISNVSKVAYKVSYQ